MKFSENDMRAATSIAQIARAATEDTVTEKFRDPKTGEHFTIQSYVTALPGEGKRTGVVMRLNAGYFDKPEAQRVIRMFYATGSGRERLLPFFGWKG